MYLKLANDMKELSEIWRLRILNYIETNQVIYEDLNPEYIQTFLHKNYVNSYISFDLYGA